MKKSLFLVTLFFILIVLTGCSKENIQFSATELNQLYGEKPEEYKKLLEKNVTVSGRVLFSGPDSENKDVYRINLSVVGKLSDGRRIVQIQIPTASMEQYKNIKINDVIEATGILKEEEKIDRKVRRIIINAEKINDKPTMKKEHPPIPEFTGEEIYNKYKNDPASITPLEGQVVKVKGTIIRKANFVDTGEPYAVIFRKNYRESVLVGFIDKKDKIFNEKYIDDEIEVYGMLVGVTKQDHREVVNVQVLYSTAIK